MSKRLRPGRYRHYKGKYYQVLGEAEHTETGERLVVYVPLYVVGNDLLRVRPRSMWDEDVPTPGNHFTYEPRFVYVGDSAAPEVQP